MPTEVIETIGASKTHTDPAAWELATRGNLVTADEVRIGEVYGQITTGNLLYPRGPTQGTTVDATRYRWLRPAAGEAYDPVADTGAKLLRTAAGTNVRLQEDYFRLGACGSDRGALGIHNDIGTSGTGSRCVRIDRRCWMDAVFAEFVGGTNVGNMIVQASVGITVGDVWITNCVALGANNVTATVKGARYGFRLDQPAGTANVYLLNSIAYQVLQGISNPAPVDYHGIGITRGARAYIYNCASLESGDAIGGDFYTVAAALGESHNISGDTTSTGTGSQTNAIAPRLWRAPATNDFRLDLTLSTGINTGKDVSSEWPESPELDFLGTAHNGDGYGYEVGPFNFDTSATPDPAASVAVGPTLGLALDANPAVADAVASGAPVGFQIGLNPDAGSSVAVGPALGVALDARRMLIQTTATGPPVSLAAGLNPDAASTIAVGPALGLQIALFPETAALLAVAPAISIALAASASPNPAIALATAPNLSAALELFPDAATLEAVAPALSMLFEVAAPRVAFELQITQTAARALLISRTVGSLATVGRSAAQSLELSRRLRSSEQITRNPRTSSLR